MSIRERPLRVKWALLLWATLLVKAVRKPPLFFVTERGLSSLSVFQPYPKDLTGHLALSKIIIARSYLPAELRY